jgi:protein-tyrosine phosphatase
MKLLFLCTGNYYRSRFAEYYIGHQSRELGLGWSVDSRGLGLTSSNVGPLSRYTIAECNRLGISYQPCRQPLALTAYDLEQADRVIALKQSEHRPLMQQLFPDWESRIEYWHVHDIDCASPEESFSYLRRLLDDLVQQYRLKADH